jgi:ABC-2 type transport system permease protein
VFVLQMLVTLAIGVVLYGASGPERWAQLGLVVLFGGFAFAGLGFGAASLIRSSEGASAVVNLVILPMAFLSGSFGPTRSYPEVLQALADVLPLTYLNDLLDIVYLEGGAIWDDLTAVAVVAGWGLAGYLVAWRRFRWMPRESGR